MSRLRIDEDCRGVDFEDPWSHEQCLATDLGDILLIQDDDGNQIRIRASDAARLSDWLASRFRDRDWRPDDIKKSDWIKLGTVGIK